MELIRFFNQLSKNDVNLAGGKGASLGEMTQANIPVPNGFVILSDSFEKFLEETDLNIELDSILGKVNHNEMGSIENSSEEIKALIMSAKMPKDIELEIKKNFKKLDAKFVAVRSSATSEDSSSAAWAGQLDSFLNTKENTLLENVKRCWASLFTPRAIFYRFEKNLHKTKISVAVVVQKMVDSEISGIAFSVHPVTQDRNQLIIEAGFGLGEAIVSGQITPDAYVVEKTPRRIIDKNISPQERGLFKVMSGGNEWKSVKEIGAQQKLSDKQILEFSEIVLRIEQHYSFPCDIEWAFEKGKFFIVQSRPITTLMDDSKKGVVSEKSFSGKKIILEKTITRDWPLFIAEMLYEGFTKEFEKQIGFKYSEVLFHFHNEQLDIYRAPEEHIEKMRSFLLSKLEENPKFISECSKNLKKIFAELMEKTEFIQKTNLRKLSNAELARLINSFIQVHSKIEPTFVINFWFPIQMENHSLNSKWALEIGVAKKTRAETEKVGPEGDKAARILSKETIRRMGFDENLSNFISVSEATDFLKNGVFPDKGELKKRKKGFVFGSLGIKFLSVKEYAETKGNEVIDSNLDFNVAEDLKKSNLTKVEKVISRDLPLANIFAWHKGYTTGMEKSFGWGYSETLFYMHNGIADTFRVPEEHNIIFKQEFLKRFNSSKKWLPEFINNYRVLLKKLSKFYSENNSIDNYSNKELWKTYEAYVSFVDKVMGPFVVMYWTPNWFSSNIDEKKKYDKIINQAMSLRKEAEDVFPKGDVLVNEILSKVSSFSKIEKNLLDFISHDELKTYLLSGTPINVQILLERKKGIIYSKKGIQLVDSSFDDALKKVGYFVEKVQVENKKELTGQSAYKGIVRGKVEIVINKHKIKHFSEGKILVAAMTTPEYVPAIKKALAVITDEGGVTCHAAIVTREMKKPCIIGTKNATRVLKDGDLIEVDADNGIVRIIENDIKENTPQSDAEKLLDYIGKIDFDVKEAKCAILLAEFVFRVYARGVIFSQSYSPVLIPYSNGMLVQIVPQEKMDGIERIIWNKAISDRKGFLKILKTARNIQMNINKKSVGFEKLLKFSDKQLLNYFNQLSELVFEVWRYYSIGEEKGLVVEEKIIPLLVKNHGLSKEDAQEYATDMTLPKEKSVFTKERLAFLELCIMISKDKQLFELIKKSKQIPKGKYSNFLKKIKGYCKKYFYSRSNFYEVVIIDEKTFPKIILNEIEKSSPEKILEEYSHIKKNEEELHKKQKEWAKKIKPTKEESEYLWYFSLMHTWIDERKVSMSTQFYYLFLILNEISQRKKIPYVLIATLTIEEIIEVLEGKEIDFDKIRLRHDKAFIVYEKTERKIFVGEDAQKLVAAVHKPKNSSILKGVIASKGKGALKVSGKVRIVNEPFKDEFNEGEILVTTMTRPEFVPIMKKARAIVTNEGGLTSHAAIFSRELGVLCIIGTKNATKVLHDGDLVEVDATKGVVRIIK